MITIQSKIHVKRTNGMSIYNFLINPSDNAYRQWWPGVHLELHNLTCNAGNIGNIVYMDEYVGKRRLKMTCIVTEVEPGKRITWQFRKIVPLPVWLYLGLEDDEKGVTVTHTIEAGFKGAGKILDFVFRAYLSDSFAKSMDEHARIEFPKLGELLSTAKSLR